MSKDEQAIKAIKDMLDRLQDEAKATQDKINALKKTYVMLTGAEPNDNGNGKRKRTVKRLKVDRQGVQKTYEFLKARGDKPTTTKMVANKFGITPEAASQRLLRLFADGRATRPDTGKYLFAEPPKAGAGSARKTATETPEAQ